jgi:hypothetical protein
LAPCLIGYGEIAKRLHADPKTKQDGNIYWKWIQNYVADDYVEAVNVGSGKFLKVECREYSDQLKSFAGEKCRSPIAAAHRRVGEDICSRNKGERHLCREDNRSGLMLRC